MPAVAKLAPQRTCVGCREVAAKSELVRLVLVAGRVVLADPHHADGRGAHLHANAECVRRALARKALNRAFREAVDTAEVDTWLERLSQASQ